MGGPTSLGDKARTFFSSLAPEDADGEKDGMQGTTTTGEIRSLVVAQSLIDEGLSKGEMEDRSSGPSLRLQALDPLAAPRDGGGGWYFENASFFNCRKLS
jgi:hypothetical protein